MEDSLQKIRQWIQARPGIFALRDENDTLVVKEHYSQKELILKRRKIVSAELQANRLKPDEDYLLLTLDNGAPLALSPQGFAFSPNFSHSGPLELPSQVYCFQDFHGLMDKLRHLAAETERRRDALDLLLVLIAILDGAKAVGLQVDVEERQVEAQLAQLEAQQ